MTSNLVVAIARRATYLFVAVAEADRVLMVRRHRLLGRSDADVCDLIAQYVQRFGATAVVVEADSQLETCASQVGCPLRSVELSHAMRWLLGSEVEEPLTRARFFSLLVARRPEFARFVRILPVTGRVAASERRLTGTLIALTLALASVSPAADDSHGPTIPAA